MSSLIAIFSFGCISQAQAGNNCLSQGTGTWSTTATWECFSGLPPFTPGTGTVQVPGTGDFANIQAGHTITVDANVAVGMLQFAGGTLNAGNYNFVLSGGTGGAVIRFPSGGTFNPDTSTVKLTDTNHTFTYNITFYNLQWATPLTAPRTLTINSVMTNAGGTFNLDGTAANPVTFAGTGNFAGPITVNNCAGKPATMTNLTCNPPAVGGGAVSAPIDFSFNHKQVETYSTDIESK